MLLSDLSVEGPCDENVTMALSLSGQAASLRHSPRKLLWAVVELHGNIRSRRDSGGARQLSKACPTTICQGTCGTVYAAGKRLHLLLNDFDETLTGTRLCNSRYV